MEGLCGSSASAAFLDWLTINLSSYTQIDLSNCSFTKFKLLQ